ncbi:hypothetical protein [Paenibacillus ginsengarvi]|uniref:Uncharacterized protein n=1 Tax=Paenibacillus ginsengarvi TaxID=400777 RepID=A0A3B0CSM9_9BACL|nr:hypothetical protein [Paenibacillus ginsengarvi]RKN86900.1 hypothetical protein D7M11_02800 [Paenibacillus ginsengarvi]
MINTLAWLLILITAVGLVLTIAVGRRQHKRVYDHNASDTTAKHPFLANPVLIAYVLFPIVIIIGAAILMLYS